MNFSSVLICFFASFCIHIEIEEFIQHPDYEGKRGDKKDDDIGLVVLKSPFKVGFKIIFWQFLNKPIFLK